MTTQELKAMEIAILTELESAHPRLMKRAALEAFVRNVTDGFTRAAFDRALSVLERKEQIRIHAGEDVTRVVITDAGLERLAATR